MIINQIFNIKSTPMRKLYFPRKEVKRKYKYELIALASLLVSLTIFCQVAMANSPISTSDENGTQTQYLKRLIEKSISTELSTIAQMNHWLDYQEQIEVIIPSAARHLPACSNILIEGRDAQRLPIGNLAKKIRCNTNEVQWTLNIRAKVAVSLPVLVAKTTINRGTRLTSNSMRLERHTLRKSQDFVSNAQEIIGLKAERRIRAGQLINSRNLQPNWLVEKGDIVLITAHKDKISASTKGIALESGVQNDQITVKNLSSKAVIHAYITRKGVVHTIF